MAKASFQKGQRVWVECVGAWALIEKVVPVWAKGFAEPVRITYDVGFGRDFNAQELQAERTDEASASLETGEWRLLRARNKWQAPEDCPHHPYPGTYPVVVTDPTDWGGWRVPGAEYDRDPHKMELQGRLITSVPHLLALARGSFASSMKAPTTRRARIAAHRRGHLRLDRLFNETPGGRPTAATRVEVA